MPKLLLLAVVLVAAGSGLAGCASPRRYVEKLKSMPDFFQADKAYGRLPRNGAAYCGPTAVANTLVWLDTHGFDKLLEPAEPGPGDQFALIRLLGAEGYMKTHPVNGTGPRRMMDAIERYCRERGYRALIEYAGWRTGSRRVAEQPTIDWMLRRVSGASSLVVNVGWYKTDDDGKGHTRTGGHYVTVVGYERRDGQTWLIIHDPAKRNHPKQRNSVERCPVTCLLRPLPDDTMLRKKVEGDPFPGQGLFILDGIAHRKSIDLGIVDGAIGFTLVPEPDPAAK